jgi:alkane 1-monooxygenase
LPIFSYIFVFLSPALAGVGLVLGGWWTLLHPVVMYGLISVFEVWCSGSTDNLPKEAERARAEHWFPHLILWGLSPVLLALIFGLLWKADSFNTWELAGLIIGVGSSVGILGINGAHELGHDRGQVSKRLAEFLLLMSLYMHFHVEHNRGHHVRVGTPADPATAREGQWLYSFWWQTLSRGLISAWKLERNRLARDGRNGWSLHNAVLGYGLLQAGLVLVVGLSMGPKAVVVWLLVALFGILILETANYFQHYGLEGRIQEDGSLVRVGPLHSWSGNHPISRMILLELPRHVDHHISPARHFSNLRHLPESPVLPLGYSGMIILSLVPPLFTRMMDKQLAAHQVPSGGG